MGEDRLATQVLLAGAIDYAGLFPPASLALPAAVQAYHEYRGGPDRWALGRFVIPAARLGDLGREVQRLPAGEPWPLSALVANAAELARLGTPGEVPAGLVADAAEGKASTPEEVLELGRACPDGITLFVELGVGPSLAECVDALRSVGGAAKLRTGGVVPEAFPRPADVVQFLRTCVGSGVPFKLTAGLHHPVRGTYPLTYAPDSARGTMYGYLNLFLAAAHLLRGGSDHEALDLVTLDAPRALTVDAAAISWGSFVFPVADLVRVRDHLPGFGSCSFREPLDDLSMLLAA